MRRATPEEILVIEEEYRKSVRGVDLSTNISLAIMGIGLVVALVGLYFDWRI